MGELDRPPELENDDATSRPLDLDEIAGLLAGWPTRFLEALSRVGVPGGAEDGLVALIAELRGVRALVDRPIFRPWRSTCAAATATISQLEDVARAYLQAIAAPTPLDAQRFASEAQVLLDGAADPISELRAKQRRVSTIESAPPSEMPVALAEAVSAEAGGASGLHGLQVVEAAGADLFCQVTGASAAPTGAGTAMYLAALVAEVSLDYPRFLRVSRRSWELFTTGSDSLRRLTSDPTWLAGHRESLVELLELSITGAAMGAAAVTDRMRVDSLLQAVHRLIEGPVQHGLATLLTSTTRRPYPRLSAGDAAALLRQAEQQGLGELLEGLRPEFRHAVAHRDFRVSDEGIVLGASRGAPLAMTPLELVDAALAAQESALGILTGLNCALFTIETDLSGGGLGAAVVGALPSSLMVRTALALMGWTDTSVVPQEDGRVLVSGVGSFGPSPGALAAALAAVLPPEFTSLAVIGRTGREVHTLDADLGAMRNFSQDVGAVSGANVVLAATRCAVDGEPLMTGAMVERWFEAQVREAIGLPFMEAVASLRFLMRLSDALGRYDLRDRASEAIRRLRS